MIVRRSTHPTQALVRLADLLELTHHLATHLRTEPFEVPARLGRQANLLVRVAARTGRRRHHQRARGCFRRPTRRHPRSLPPRPRQPPRQPPRRQPRPPPARCVVAAAAAAPWWFRAERPQLLRQPLRRGSCAPPTPIAAVWCVTIQAAATESVEPRTALLGVVGGGGGRNLSRGSAVKGKCGVGVRTSGTQRRCGYQLPHDVFAQRCGALLGHLHVTFSGQCQGAEGLLLRRVAEA